MRTLPALLLLAAGAARRMGGRDKLLETVGGEALLARQAGAGLAAGLEVLVTLPAEAPAREAALAGLAARIVRVPDAVEGMAASIRAGVRALAADAPGVMILPADMPAIGADDLAALAAAFAEAPEGILRAAAADGTPGHPVIFPRRLFGALAGLSGDEGARSLLADEDVRLCARPGRRALIDLDPPEEWAAWRQAEGG